MEIFFLPSTASSTTPATTGRVSTTTKFQTTSSVSTLTKIVTPKTTAFTAKHTTTAPETSTRFAQITSQPVTTSQNVSTHVSTASEKPTTEVQIERCNIHTENKSFSDEFGCVNTQPIQQTSCQGFCNSRAITNVTSPWVHVECFCCKPKNLSGASVSMTCPDGGVKVLKYVIITECSCESCESNAYEAKLRTVVGTMFGNTTNVRDANILN